MMLYQDLVIWNGGARNHIPYQKVGMVLPCQTVSFRKDHRKQLLLKDLWKKG